METLDVRYRPQTLDEVVGDETLIEGIRSMIAKPVENRPHMILLYGTYGCGKTSLARIIAREFGCAPEAFMEYNVGNTRGIAAAREMTDGLWNYPLLGPIRVICLDECQGGTEDFWQCLLKNTEEPPDHIYFILCTTEPGELPVTVHSRAKSATFRVSALEDAKIELLLRRILSKEFENPEEFPRAIIEEIIKRSDGVPRNAVKLLELVIDVENPELAVKMLRDAYLEVGMEGDTKELAKALLESKPWDTVAPILKKMKADTDAEKTRYALLGYYREVLLNSGNQRAADLMDALTDSFRYTKFSGLVLACYLICTTL